MKHIKLYEEFVNEVYRVPVKYGEDTFNSHKKHNPTADIVERQINKDTKVTYGIYVKDSGSKKKGDEFMEIYTGENYVVGSTAKSYSRHFDADKIPAAYRKTWEELKTKYETELKESITEAAEPKFVVHKGAAVMGYASSKIQARQNAKVQGAEYSTVEDYKEQYGDKFITEAAEPNIPKSEWEESNQRAENGPWVCAKWKGKYYCAVGIMHSNGDLDYVEDVEEIDKSEYDSLMK